MLDRNPGLRDISPSVTGGSVTAQGVFPTSPSLTYILTSLKATGCRIVVPELYVLRFAIPLLVR